MTETAEGSRPSGEIHGTFSQMGMQFPLNLQMGVPLLNRPQEPQPPYPYRTEEVTFSSGADGAVMAGTLTWPTGYGDNGTESGNIPAVLMITGSGSQNRDEEIFNHKPFLVLADWLARHGIASLRYDDRGMGESERGTVEITTGTNMQDALAGIRYLRSLGEFGPVGAIGHSEGGQIVFMLGAADEADFIISMAGPGMRGDSILVEQNRLILTRSGFTPESADNYGRVLSGMLEMKMEGYATDSPETLVDSLITALEAQNIPFGSAANDRQPLDAVFPAVLPRPGHIPHHLPRICPQRQSRPAGSAGQLRAHPQTSARRPSQQIQGIPAHPQTSARRPSQQIQGIPRSQPPLPALHHRYAHRIRKH